MVPLEVQFLNGVPTKKGKFGIVHTFSHIKMRMEMEKWGMSKRQQPNHRADNS